jgi:hypothetical protein
MKLGGRACEGTAVAGAIALALMCSSRRGGRRLVACFAGASTRFQSKFLIRRPRFGAFAHDTSGRDDLATDFFLPCLRAASVSSGVVQGTSPTSLAKRRVSRAR